METCKIILEKIQDENVNVCTNGHDKLFLKSGKDFLIARGIFLMLCEKVFDDFWKLVKDYDRIHIMNYNNDVVLLSLKENLNSSYYVPMVYDDGEITGKVNFTEIMAKKHDIDYNIGRIMHSVFIQNKEGKEYFGLFNSVNSLRRVFPKEQYNILAIDFDDILTFCDDKDIVVTPTICDLAIPQKLLRNVKSIEFLYADDINGQIRKMNDLDFGCEEGFNAYTNVLNKLYEFDNLFIITSEIDYPEFEGKPLVRKIDDGNVINVFTNFDLAIKWCQNYKVNINGVMPIGLMEKKNNYLSLFQIAKFFNIGIMLNEGEPYVIFNPADFVGVNKLTENIDVVFKSDELENVMKGNIPKIDFNKYKIALPVKK